MRRRAGTDGRRLPSRIVALATVLLAPCAVFGAAPDTAQLKAYIDAAKYGTPATVERWLQRIGRANVDAEQDGSTALAEALSYNADPNVALVLLRNGASPTQGKNSFYAPLAMASRKNVPTVVRELIARGALVEHGADRGAQALADAPDAEMVRLLLRLGADPEARTRLGETPLLAHCRVLWEGGNSASSPQTLALIEGGANVNATVPSSSTAPLALVVANGNVALIAALLEHGAQASGSGQYGSSPLINLLHDASHANAQVLALLLQHGADPNESHANGPTPLTLTGMRPDLTRMLLDAGADPKKPGTNGKTPVQLATDPGVIVLLVKSGGATPWQERLIRLHLPPYRLTRFGESAAQLAFFAWVLLPVVVLVLFLFAIIAFARKSPGFKPRAAGAGNALLAVVVFYFVAYVLVKFLSAGGRLAAMLLAITWPFWVPVVACVVAFVAYRRGRHNL